VISVQILGIYGAELNFVGQGFILAKQFRKLSRLLWDRRDEGTDEYVVARRKYEGVRYLLFILRNVRLKFFKKLVVKFKIFDYIII